MMFFRNKEHNPPHIHAIYGEFVFVISIKDLDLLEGSAPKRVINLVKEWVSLHQKELLEMWNTGIFSYIEPLN